MSITMRELFSLNFFLFIFLIYHLQQSVFKLDTLLSSGQILGGQNICSRLHRVSADNIPLSNCFGKSGRLTKSNGLSCQQLTMPSQISMALDDHCP